jgi:hypothetical protein
MGPRWKLRSPQQPGDYTLPMCGKEPLKVYIGADDTFETNGLIDLPLYIGVTLVWGADHRSR